MSQSVHIGETRTVSARIPVSEANLLYKEADQLKVPVSRLIQSRLSSGDKSLLVPQVHTLGRVPEVDVRLSTAGKVAVSGGGGGAAALVSYQGMRSAGYDYNVSRNVGVATGIATFALIFSLL